MKQIIKKLRLKFILTIAGTLLAPAIAFAVVQTLNGATGQTQTFVNDNNVTVTTSIANNTHTFGWSGFLPVSRGGTGAGSFTAGSILFSNGASISQDNTNLSWDDAADILSINGIEIWQEGGGQKQIDAPSGFNLQIRGGPPQTATSDGGSVELEGGTGGATSGDGGNVSLTAGNSPTAMGGSIALMPGESGGGAGDVGGSLNFFTGPASGGTPGLFKFWNNDQSSGAIFDVESITADRTFIFPDFSGTFGLLEVNQTWTGLNKFESIASSSIYVGSPTKSGCIVMGDSDGSGVTYLTANNGVLTAFSTKPSICQ